ncbi:unnamed protein product [Phytophthora lilii]|uniref:Unnamed protein product n=1 Tax=Phytophthora lilii TaxID=2077276 RepID=A0A9W6WVX6_9STRA|nr:unnamed protein product [Phytophthora lilii]
MFLPKVAFVPILSECWSVSDFTGNGSESSRTAAQSPIVLLPTITMALADVGLAALHRLVREEFAQATSADAAEPLPEEVEEGNVEYKQQLLEPAPDRLRQLTTQMHWRLNEGGGTAFYELGVRDNGELLGLSEDAMLRSLGTLARLSGEDPSDQGARTQLHQEASRWENFVGMCFVLLVADVLFFLWGLVSVIGDFESGKSTLVGVLTRGCLDDGAGLARMQVCRHRHELENGCTSSVSEHTIAVAADGHFRSTDELATCDFGDSDEEDEETTETRKQESYITLSDMAGHKKYLKSTASGLAGQFPDYAMLVVDATQGVRDMTREHIKIATALEVAIFVVITKTDLATDERIQQSLVEVADLLKTFCPCQRVILAPKGEGFLKLIASSAVPLFQISSVDGSGLDVLQEYLAALEPKRVWAAKAKTPAEFQVSQAYDVEDEGTIVTGLVQAGTLSVGERMLLGPDALGKFCDVAVESIEVQHKAAQSLSAGETGAVLIRFLHAVQPAHRIRKGTMLVHPSVRPMATRQFDAELHFLPDARTFRENFQAVIHTGQCPSIAMASPNAVDVVNPEDAQETKQATTSGSGMHLDLENITGGDRSKPQQQGEEEPKKKTKIRKRRGPRALTIEEVFATLSNARSSGLNPPPERIVLTPRSAEACLRCGVNPETLKIRDLDSFYDPDVTAAIQRMRHEAYSLRRHEEMQALRTEKRKLVDAEDRGASSTMPSRLVAVAGSKRVSKSPARPSAEDADGPPSMSSGTSSSPGKKGSSALLEIERQRLEKVRQRQERELEQMLDFEMKMNRLQQEAAEKMEREKRQHEAMDRSRMRFAQELAAEKRAREIKKKAQLDAEEERRKELAAQLAARDRALAEEKARQDKLRRIEAREREEERKIKAEEHRAQTEALLHAQQMEIQARLRELDLAEKAREEMVEQQRAERAIAMDARRREVTQRIRKNLRASKKLEAQRKREIQRKQAASEALRHAHEEEERRARELQAQQQLALEKKRQLVLEEARREENRKQEELLQRQREIDHNVQQVQKNKQHQRALRTEYRRLQAQLKLDKVERMKRIQEYQRLEMLRKLQDTEARTQHMLNEKESLVHRRKQLAIKTKIQRDLIMRTMENVKITKKWHQASKTIEKVLNGGSSNRSVGSRSPSHSPAKSIGKERKERPKSSSSVIGRQTSLPTLSQPNTPITPGSTNQDHQQSKVFRPPSPPPTKTAFKFTKEAQELQNNAAGNGNPAQPYFSPYDAVPTLPKKSKHVQSAARRKMCWTLLLESTGRTPWRQWNVVLEAQPDPNLLSSLRSPCGRTDMAIEETMNVSAAFQINLGASLGTLLGGFIVFSQYLLRVVNPRAMSVWLSFAGGLTLFQSLVVLFSNSLFEFVHAFTRNGEDRDTVMGQAWLTATGCFGVGIVLNFCLDLFVKQLTPGQRQSLFARMHAGDTFQDSLEAGTPELKSPIELMQSRHFLRMDESTKEKLQRLGILNIIAIAVHNIPGGVATMVASSEHTFIGLALAVGVGLHNIAEGIAVATPVYFATGSKWKGVMWCFVASISQHLGGFLAFGILGKNADDFSQAVLYGLVSGMLTCISLKGIFPTAHMYANGRAHLVSGGGLFGMVFMAASLILFKYMGV